MARTEWSLVVATASLDLAQGTGFLGRTFAYGEFYAGDADNVSSSFSEHQVATCATVVDSVLEGAIVPALWAGVSIVFGHSVGLHASLDVDAFAVASNDRLDPSDLARASAAAARSACGGCASRLQMNCFSQCRLRRCLLADAR